MINKREDPSTTSHAYDAMQPVWEKIDTVLGGTKAMRAAGERYLPRHSEESDIGYQERRDRATLLNQTEITLNSWVGRPFSQPVRIGSDVPTEIQKLFENIDLRGNQITVFARDWFKVGLAKALAHVLIDSPSIDKSGRTLRDDQKERVRPYWTFIRPENLIFASAEVLNGREVLTHVRIREQYCIRDGFSESVVNRIRVFDRSIATGEVTFSLYELRRSKSSEQRWVRTLPPTPIDIDEIPLVTFYADRDALMFGKPPIEDLVDLNIAHWQSGADQCNVLTVARFPILAVSGVDDDETEGARKKVPLGPRKVLTTPETAGKWYYVEHQGNAIAAGRQDLQDLEIKMSHYGAEFLQQRPGSTTATARALDSAEATSPLQDAVVRFNDALNQAIVITGKWMDVEDPGQVLISTDFHSIDSDQADFAALTQARSQRDISRKAFLHELKRRGTLGDDFDPEADLEELKNEDPLGGAEDIDLLAQDAGMAKGDAK